MKAQVSCVVRVLGGRNELVRIEDSFNHVRGEKVLSGIMTSDVISSGPSNSHRVTVWSPGRNVVESAFGIEAFNDDVMVEDAPLNVGWDYMPGVVAEEMIAQLA